MKNQASITFKISVLLILLIIAGTVNAKPDAKDRNTPMPAISTASAIGGYNVYYGHLHNHSNVSDGAETPDYAYNYAKNTAGLDFFGLSDHASAIGSTEWTTIKNAANTYNEDGVFVAFWGFEWSHSTQGHVTIINTDDYCTTNSEPNFSNLLSWVNSRECAAFFNHPGRQNSTDQEFGQFLNTPSEKFVGMELWNKTDIFNVYYYNDGYYSSDGNLGYFDEALIRDWKIGAGGSEDNHTADWGTRTDNRLAVLANSLTRADIYDAIKNKRFFTTLDRNLKMSFKINGQEMGSTVQGNSGQSLQITASDDDGEVFTKVQLLLNGTVLSTWSPGTSDVSIIDNISTSDGDYYYIKVTQADGDEAISSPIFIEGGITNVSPLCAITSPENGQHYDLTQSIVLSADATDSDGTISQVEFFVDGVSVGTDNSSSYEVSWTIPANGAYTITAKATDNLGAVTSSDPVNITVGTFTETVSVQIASSNDDVEEGQNGTIYTNSTDLELIYDTYMDQFLQTVGLHFPDLNIPQGATITNAWVQFTVDEASTGTVDLTISGDASDDSPAFTSSAYELSNRNRTTNTVSWSPSDWNTVNEAGVNQQTPNLSTVIQEIVDRPGFTATSAISLFITGTETNKRVAVAYDGVPSSAAVLIIDYIVGDQNIPPVAAFTLNANYLTVNFTDESSDSDGTISAWLWDFGDGNTSTSQNPTHTYSSSGTYTVTLIVLDNDNASDNTSQQFTVNCLDTDGDGVCDSNDDEINSPCPDNVDEFGVSVDTDNDGLADCLDGCPDDPNKITPGACGCGVPDTDSDNDGVADCNDLEEDSPCPQDVDENGVSFDTDNDGISDCLDQELNSPCPDDINDYGVSIDTDGDGLADCLDGCPDDANKTTPGDCGCGIADTDTDNDGIADCIDGCPNDPNKTEPGDCGCGVADTDADNDGISDCIDPCIAQTTGFTDNSLSHTGTGSNSTTLILPNKSQDVSFTISNIDEKTRPASKSYDEWVTVQYDNGFGNTTLGTYSSVSSVLIEIPETVVSVTVSLTDGGDGDSGTSTMSITFSPVNFCVANVEPCNDDDNDGVCNEVDQCPGFDDYADEDGDEIPDGCDTCNDLIDTDGDGISDCVDLELSSPCPGNVDAYGVSLDSDGDGICDENDICSGYDDNIDTDADGVPDGCDICPGFNDTVDTDGDGIPDDCDPCNDLIDSDGDGFSDCIDAEPNSQCPNIVDDNGVSIDSDGDGVCDDIDNCPNVANADQLDSNNDGIGDACEASDYCVPENMIITGDFIRTVTVGSFTETFGLGSGYEYYTDNIVSLSTGTNTVELTPENSKNRNYWKIWIDSDYDGVFDDLSETVLSIPSKKGTISAQISVPAITRNTRMRISMRNLALPLPCDDNFEGDVKDFELSPAASTKSASMNPSILIEEELSFKVYPNPFVDEINILINGTREYEKSSVHIHDIAGKLVYTEVYGKQGRITIQDLQLNPGTYFITVQLDDWTKTEQLIKTH
ncbi:CehA/McbA family metallohydrolase [Maribellus sediminis]|uniref:CehA/McbA family metallohydrolase n=1 Tax=Maribellus sediminis TaxID=2696285 RepID=UPI00142FF4F7|nr:CehA/McbA family metallohydrolase [Maribellus sediminis]